MTTSRHLLRQCSLVLIIPLLLGAGYYGLAYTQQGLQLSLKALSIFVPGHVRYTHVTGTWTSEIRFSKISYRNPKHQLHLSAENLSIRGHFFTLGPNLKSDIHWQQLRIRIAKKHSWLNPKGHLSASGTFSNYQVNFNGNFIHPDYPNSHVSLQLQHQYNHWQLLSLEIGSQNATHTLTATGQLTPTFNLQWQVNALQLSILQPQATGLVTGTGTITGTRAKPTIETQATIKQFSWLQNSRSLKIPKLEVHTNFTLQKSFNVKLKAQKSQFDNVSLPPEINLSAQGKWRRNNLYTLVNLNTQSTILKLTFEFPGYKGLKLPMPTQKFRSTFNANIEDMHEWPIHCTYLDDPHGQATAKLHLGGTLKKPIVRGSLHIQKAYFNIPALGLHVQDVLLKFEPINNHRIAIQGQAMSGQGVLHLNGTLVGFPQHPTANLKVTGSHILTTNTSRLVLYTTPDLTLELTPQRLKTAGTVHIPEAKIRGRQAAEVNLSSDVKFIHKKIRKNTSKPTAVTRPFSLEHDIQLILGNKVSLNDQGLSARISGQLRIKAAADHLTTANGELLLQDGKYQAYGQDLTISQGELRFAGGAITNPGLNIRAERTMMVTTSSLNQNNNSRILSAPTQFDHTTTDLKIGLMITGTAEQPNIQLFSEPSGLSQNDILAYLLLGRSADKASTADNQYLWQAASALSTGTQSGIGHTLKKSLKIDDISIQSTLTANNEDRSTPEPTPTLVLGKHLNKKLYLSYQIGLLEPLNTLRLLYKFSHKWSMQAETGDHESGMDLYYTIEKD